MSMIYKTIEQWQIDTPWGNVLDAGTGEQSLQWLLSLNSESATAITASRNYYEELNNAFQLTDNQELVIGNWMDHSLLTGRTYDVILADYLLGAVDGFAPYFQHDLLKRLKRHLSPEGSLYFIGLEPLPDYSENSGDCLIIRVAKLRDACILLAGHRCYREYPLEWVHAQLIDCGFEVVKTKPFFNQFGSSFATSQLEVARSKLPFIQDTDMRQALSAHIDALEKDIDSYIKHHGPISLGFDYLIQATLRK